MHHCKIFPHLKKNNPKNKKPLMHLKLFTILVVLLFELRMVWSKAHWSQWEVSHLVQWDLNQTQYEGLPLPSVTISLYFKMGDQGLRVWAQFLLLYMYIFWILIFKLTYVRTRLSPEHEPFELLGWLAVDAVSASTWNIFFFYCRECSMLRQHIDGYYISPWVCVTNS